MNNKSYEELWKMLPSSVDANLRFAQLVINSEPCNTRYFFGDYSYEIIKWIAISVYSANAKEIDDLIRNLYGEYFEFVTYPVDDLNQPQWRQLKLYKGAKGLKLRSWLMKNSHQHFVKKKMVEKLRAANEDRLADFVDYQKIIETCANTEDITDEEYINRVCLNQAWASISEKDKTILLCLIIKKMSWKDAFDKLSGYINPREGRQAMETWTDKRKQDALALMKIRALKHLSVKFNQLKS